MKRLVSIVFTTAALPSVLVYRLLVALAPSRTEQVFQSFGQAFSLFPGTPGDYLRRAFFRLTLAECADDVCISFGSYFVSPVCRVEAGVYIGPFCIVAHSHLKRDTLLGSHVMIMSGKKQHRFTRLDVPIRHQGGEDRVVSIGPDCWIGNAALIMADIGSGAVVGAGSVVTKPVQDLAIVSGSPAAIVGIREHRAN